jgi:hypothetical protein
MSTAHWCALSGDLLPRLVGRIIVNGRIRGLWMAKKSVTEKLRSRSGPRAPAGKKPLMVILDQDLIKAAKIAGIEDGRNVSGIVQELLEAWLASRKTRR